MPQLSRRIGPKFQVLLAFANTIIGLILLSLLPATPVLAIPAVKSVKIIGTNLAVNFATQEGQPYDARAIDKDVHQLWGAGRFSDIHVETISNKVTLTGRVPTDADKQVAEQLARSTKGVGSVVNNLEVGAAGQGSLG